MELKQLLVENEGNPLGIDVKEPVLSWKFGPGKPATIQVAYRIIVSDDEQKAKHGIGNIWDSGKVFSRRNVNIIYKGADLVSKQRYYWKVEVWDSHDEHTVSDSAWWEMGLLNEKEWTAEWIGRREDNNKPMPLFRKEFTLEKPVASARVYISGMGHYELRLNGEKIGDRVLEPGWTNYDKTCFYSVYDVTSSITARNAIGVMLGNGFFNVAGGRYTKFKDSFGKPKCIVQLVVNHPDGTITVIESNEEWQTSYSPITFSCIYGGEDYDASLEQEGWDKPGFELNGNWENASVVTAPQGTLTSQKNSPLKVMKTFQPIAVERLGEDKYLIDFGQNFSGWIHIEVDGKKGSAVKMIPSEVLTEEGLPNQTPSGSPYEFNYLLKGEGKEDWNPRFTYYGFRYVQIEGATPPGFESSNQSSAKLLKIEGQMIYPDIEISGQFVTSDKTINKIHEIINWSILSNMKSVFTDCPHREKLGWLEQNHLMGPSILYNYSVDNLFTKMMADIKDAQLPNGMVPTTAPEYVVFEKPWDIFRHSVSWGATYILAAWFMYQKFGNNRLILDHYDGMRDYISYLETQSDNYIITDGLGDWYDVGEQGPGFAQNTPVPLVDTAMFYHVVDTFAKITGMFASKKEDTIIYAELAEKIKDAFNARYFNKKTCQYGSNSQASNAMPIAVGIVENHYKDRVFNNLIDDIIKHNYHTTAGDVGHRYVLQALTENNRSDIIMEMTKKTDYPSYGYQVVHGATTLTEAWDGPTVGHSQNHFMLGHIEEWFYSGLAGLNYSFDSETDAYSFTIKPYIADELEYVKAVNNLTVGDISTAWERTASDKIKLTIEVPVNTTATVFVPGDSADSVTEAGTPVSEHDELTIKEYKNGYLEIGLSSGYYTFESTVKIETAQKS